ncbi:hypothetical protein CPB83DRAFT_354315 [Crepidotus variabilis]|uniref:Uncharacterized protein n=1 Tax=Crepidotus variabilis TaxID=179855 RepID=A0A9P6JP99_9AGAR|nr:hypothetical protein CPB83DRAFT_354315 [Crepidotus variabilis]
MALRVWRNTDILIFQTSAALSDWTIFLFYAVPLGVARKLYTGTVGQELLLFPSNLMNPKMFQLRQWILMSISFFLEQYSHQYDKPEVRCRSMSSNRSPCSSWRRWLAAGLIFSTAHSSTHLKFRSSNVTESTIQSSHILSRLFWHRKYKLNRIA